MNSIDAQDTIEREAYFVYPKAFKKWHGAFLAGASITRLPTEVVEEEISTSPVLTAEYRLGLPKKWNLCLKLSSNYISNLGALHVSRSLINKKFALALGGNASMWFGHLELQAIKLKSYGVILSPQLTFGYDFRKYFLSVAAEVNYGFMRTFSNEEELATFKQNQSLFAIKIAIEQPLWKTHSFLLFSKLNYAQFYYQSWLSYSTLSDYLLYPEFGFAFII